MKKSSARTEFMKEKQIQDIGFGNMSGITLIALVITIIIMLILAGVALSIASGENGILTQSIKSIEKNRESKAKEEVLIAWSACETEYYAKGSSKAEVYTKDNLNKYLSATGEVTDLEYNENGKSKITYISKDNNVEYNFEVEANGTIRNVTSGTVIVIGEEGKEEQITEQNLADYLGKAVKYTPTSPSSSYGTATTYKIFYVDFDNKYGDGEGTIYLKADYDNKAISAGLTLASSSSDSYAIMKKLNREWNTVRSGTVANDNEKAVAWLTDPDIWKGWKDNTLGDKVNYVVGSPSVEMFVDSYNIKYATKIAEGTENYKGQECQYPVGGTAGYQVRVKSGIWDTYTASGSLVDTYTNNMYRPNSKYFWLASPAGESNGFVMLVSYTGRLDYNFHTYTDGSVCPLISLKTDVILELK